MAAAVISDIPAISVPSSIPSDYSVPSSGSLSPPKNGVLLPAGAAYIQHVRRILQNISLEEDIANAEKEAAKNARAAQANGDANGDAKGLEMALGDEEEDPDLLARDPKEWKQQDHYAVLGLQDYRYKANDEQIKISHRRKVLRHHPDKKAGQAGETNDDGFFKCIQKAMEVLTNPERRRQYDSVDQHYIDMQDDIPSATVLTKRITKDPQEFFEVFTPIFEVEARFSNKQPVPMLGEMDASKAEVEGFYDFWYNFDSWRSFEYLDKEVNEGSDSRDDKRYTEKKNKSERARRKKEDNTRLRSLVDQALSLDPRIKRIKEEDKKARAAKKNVKANGAAGGKSKEEIEKEKKAAEEEAKRKEEEEKASKADAKKAKAAAANAAKKARRAARAAEEANGSAA